MRRFIAGIVSLVVTVCICLSITGSSAAQASTSPGNTLLNIAETRTGDWYVYNAAGPNYFDCSGLVFWSARQMGVTLPRTTYSMPSSGWLYRVYNPQRGDLAFFAGYNHVELITSWYHTTFGAAHSGTQVGWHTYYPPAWAPVAYYRLR